MKTIHLTAGDALAGDLENTKIDGVRLVCREAFVDGPVDAPGGEEFWAARAAFVADAFGETAADYRRKTVAEFEKLESAAAGENEINLWFEYELFCRVNYWFCLDRLRDARVPVFVVAPAVRSTEDRWQGFGGLSGEALEKCFAERRRLSAAEIKTGGALWRAFRTDDSEELKRLSENGGDGLPFLNEVIAAALDRKTRVPQILREISDQSAADFPEIFRAFQSRAGVYGYGDAQVRRLL
ncbi:MAG: hypothetical protein JSS81_21555 [Acidobacteria bacterium]|nr:hypothetical protein [Acidobacteriota bacterium]